MRGTRALLLVGVAAMVVLAGCSGGGSSPSATPTQSGAGTPTGSDAAQTDAARLRSAVIDATESVETYAVEVNQSIRLAGPVERTQTVERRTTINRTARELARTVSVTARGRTRESQVYIVDETLYLRSQANVRRYSSKWIKQDVSENFSRVWAAQDSLDQHRRLLANASSLELRGTDTVDGREVRMLNATIAPDRFAEFLAGQIGIDAENVTVHRASMTVAVATDSDRPVRVSTTFEYTISGPRRSIRQTTSGTYSYDYDVTAAITLPDAAADAVNASSDGAAPRVDAALRSSPAT